MEERWVSVEGFPEYQISNTGLCKGLKGQLIKPIPNGWGYVKYALFKNRKQKRFFAHRLVAMHFIPNPNNYEQVNHLDCNKMNNHVSNLEWCTRSENQKHAYRMGRKHNAGSCNPSAKLKEEQVRTIKILLSQNGATDNMRKIASDFGIAFRTIENIKYGSHWKSVTL